MQSSLQTLLQNRSQNEKSLSQSQEKVTQQDAQQRQLEGQRNQLQQALDEVRDQLEIERMQSQELIIHCKTVDEQLQISGFDLEVNYLIDN